MFSLTFFQRHETSIIPRFDAARCAGRSIYHVRTKKLPKLNWKGFDEFVEAQLKEWDAPGCAVAVVKDGEIILAKGYGLRDVKNTTLMKAGWEFATSIISQIHAFYTERLEWLDA